MFANIAEFQDWYGSRCRVQEYRVTRIALDDLDGWTTSPDTGNLVHRSGRFFSVEGLALSLSGRAVDSWHQPIIIQPDRGLLGILVQEIEGELRCLLQVKMEPGNVNGLQLSPTVQATQSNFTGVHGGKAVPYTEFFFAPRLGRVLSDVFQSEQASWFLSKRNRNMIVQVDPETVVPVQDDFCWLTLRQIDELLLVPNLVNMDARTVLAGAVEMRLRSADDHADTFLGDLARSWSRGSDSLYSTIELLSWFTEAKSRCTMARRVIPLSAVEGWFRQGGELVHERGQHFAVIGVDVETSSREVARWHQPMFEPRSRGVIAFLIRRIGDSLHFLIQARVETGALDHIEIAPTVQCQPENYSHLPAAARPPFLDVVMSAPPERIRADAVHSEEGGRFFHAQNRYLLIEVDDAFPLDVPGNFAWASLGQLTSLVQFGNYLNVEARILLTIIGFYQEAVRL